MCRNSSENLSQKKSGEDSGKQLSIGDFFDPTCPWDLRDRLPGEEAIRKIFSFVPDRFKEGSWLLLSTWVLAISISIVLYVTVDANIKFRASHNDTGIMEDFVGGKFYKAFTVEWYYNIGFFLWMNFVSWKIYSFHSSFGAWVSFTMWSWTIMSIRHGLCSIAPFFPSVRLLTGALRFPVLLSASITFGIWNFVLMPTITLGFLKGERRHKFIRWAFTWKLCQIHVFNILYAYLNCVWAEPNAQPLHLGDANAGVIYILAYISFYYLVLDRIGVHLYPIFSPRTCICIPSWIMTAAICVGNYKVWNSILSANA